MTTVKLPCRWLDEAWGGKKTQDMLPIFTISDKQIKITIFPNGAAGMRVVTRPIETPGNVTFKVPKALRAFVRLMVDFQDVSLLIEGTSLTITGENCCSAVQYHFPNIELTDDNEIVPHPQDVSITVPTSHWLSLWKTIPPKGEISMVYDKSKRSITLKHSKGRWGAAIQAREKPLRSGTFICDAKVGKRVFSDCTPETPFSVLILMDCGVLKWKENQTTIYLAPMIEK